ncbi:hypothetical protein SAMN06264365_110281 [Actinoplanes regularis]|uniref:Uncharacterized protein n=1 Tax=Actinoplanes regularis TaxID=52697 RepID=A0A239C425_9ACTN|nr:hypothetical protein SAMN06264365_110281 [Actinoplanes regularis]
MERTLPSGSRNDWVVRAAAGSRHLPVVEMERLLSLTGV